jgi:ribose 5-phosphate isomerase A
MSADAYKKAVGEAAAALIEDGMTVGLGTGSTAAFLVDALGRRAREEGLKLRCVATSLATDAQARGVGLTMVDLNDAGEIDLTIDGADEIGPGLALIKGGGAALLREKLVWEASRRCVAIADASKLVQTLGQFPLPIEVVRFGHQHTSNAIADVLADFGLPAPRLRVKDGAAVITDGGNVLYDAGRGAIEEPAQLAAALKTITGVVDHGLFLDMADQAIVAGETGVQTLTP